MDDMCVLATKTEALLQAEPAPTLATGRPSLDSALPRRSLDAKVDPRKTAEHDHSAWLSRGARRAFSKCQDTFFTVYHIWERWQVSGSGRYTAPRLRALAAYSNEASPVRVLLVLVLTPVPILCFLIGVESIPLADPQHGWRANYVWWIRHTLYLVTMTFSCIVQIKTCMPSMTLSVTEIIVIVVGTNLGYVGFLVCLASAWVFPIPFVFALTGGFYSVLLLVHFSLVLRRQRRSRITPSSVLDSRKFASFKIIVVLQTLLASVYPAFEQSFILLDSRWQLVFPLALFAMKFCFKQLMALSIRRSNLETCLPELIVLTIELFHVLYLTSCLTGRSFSILWMCLVSAVELMQSWSSVYGLLRYAKHVQDIFDYQEARRSNMLENAVEILLGGDFPNSRDGPIAAQTSLRKASGAVHPEPEQQGRVQKSKRLQLTMIDETMRVFSKSEYFVLIEYVECVIPIIYAVFHATLRNLPNVVFYSNVATQHMGALFANVTFFVTVRLLSLVGFSVFLHHRLQFSVFHQLAFALETEIVNVQAKFAIFIPYCLFFFLAHNGVDFGFEFKWIRGE